ncbi:hypothetical protein PVAP13_8NG299701 [Panicum virgatum]|uniref:Uncharacterized protein n=1 Tax=Panicum virgatum TaxID=38727 RepID=A0A8T0PB83_PANVG|nr:hypothetical protein PVAP13_8NG299701 [Panicum virgatum]
MQESSRGADHGSDLRLHVSLYAGNCSEHVYTLLIGYRSGHRVRVDGGDSSSEVLARRLQQRGAPSLVAGRREEGEGEVDAVAGGRRMGTSSREEAGTGLDVNEGGAGEVRPEQGVQPALGSVQGREERRRRLRGEGEGWLGFGTGRPSFIRHWASRTGPTRGAASVRAAAGRACLRAGARRAAGRRAEGEGRGHSAPRARAVRGGGAVGRLVRCGLVEAGPWAGLGG